MGLSVAAPPLVEQTVARLRRDLLAGVHGPGVKLKVEHLSARYGCSSSPLREALNQLAHEGLVIGGDRRGFRVASMSLEDFDDITRLRLLLDTQALTESIERGTDEWEARSLAAFHRLQRVEARLPEGPVVLNDEWSALHKDFHMALLSATGSPRLKQSCSSLFDQAERYRRFSAMHRDQPRSKSREHEAILHATIGRKTDKAVDLLTGHIRRTRDHVTEAIAKLSL